MDKRLKEINDRKLEIRSMLQGEEKVDLDALEKELADLEAEATEIRRRQEVAAEINAEETKPAEVREIAKPAVAEERSKEMDLNSIEYRKAFMKYVTTGVMDAELRGDANTLTTDIGAVIPPETQNRIVEELKSYGNILPLVTNTNYLPGVAIPTSATKPVATWVAEGAGSDKQKKVVGSVVFGHYKLRCAVSVSLESEYMSLSAFENALVDNITEAMAIALEAAIIAGDANGEPTGILHVPSGSTVGQTVQVTALSYDVLTEAEGKLPTAYENGAVWVMSKKTFMDFIGMVDEQGHPIARVDHGINVAPERYLLGRQVVLTDNVKAFASASAGDCFAFLFRMKDYCLNTNFRIGIKTYEDNDTDDIVRKSIVVADGKPVDTHSLVKLVKGA
ncbi:MAG: phage major capsid protein [Clostridium sp.]|nr:phage major capsid protein [Clostridium sp.]